MRRSILAFSVSLIAVTAAHGQDQRLLSILASPKWQADAIETSKHSTVMLQNPCAIAEYKLSPRFVPYLAPQFDASNAITGGAWKASIEMNGCGAHRILNVITAVTATNTTQMFVIAPGTTRADFQLQKDAVGYALISASAKGGGREQNCKIGYLADTEFLDQSNEPPLAGAKGPAWREKWTLISCTKKAEVILHFIPDATGTTIAAEPATVTPYP